MCGIFGYIKSQEILVKKEQITTLTNQLFKLSESRGKESSGIAIWNEGKKSIFVTKDDIPATELIKSKEYEEFLQEGLANFENGPLGIIAHSRLVTNGTQENNLNNQPVIKDGIVMIHNGIVTNVDFLWNKYKAELTRESEVDTEVIASLTRYYIKQGIEPAKALVRFFGEMEGAASVVLLFDDRNQIIMATNTGSMYYLVGPTGKDLLFGSEEYILKQIKENPEVNERFRDSTINWVAPFTGLSIELAPFLITPFSFFESDHVSSNGVREQNLQVLNKSKIEKRRAPDFVSSNYASNEKMLEYNFQEISALRRCTKCILPETFPFIEFDGNGVCNYCNNYVVKGLTVDKRDQFKEILSKYKTKSGKPDCLVAFSGGRDSSYGLHLLKTEFEMNPITFTYDWGMVTDLARRNIARMTGKLGIENILISADIKMKRNNVRKNVLAWLKRPELGMIPLFMAGDKYFFKYVNDLRKQTGIHCDIWMENKLENTDFKSGFAGIKPDFTKTRIDRQTTWGKIQMPLYYLKNFMFNPSYINSSLVDTYGAFKAYYVEPREVYLLLFDYIPWDEKQIESTLIKEYNWELSPDTTSSWRIGDGTASFYNYIYFTVAGFSEFETFRSNQIREGMMDRKTALSLSLAENKPRYLSMQNYLDTIQIDWNFAIQKINRIPKLYR